MNDELQRIAGLIREGRKLEAVKRLRQATGCGLQEALAEVERLQAELSGRPVPPPPVPEAGGEVAEDVVALVLAGKHIEAIKRHRERTGLGLKEAKDAVDAVARAHGRPPSGCAPKAAVLVAVVLLVGLAFG